MIEKQNTLGHNITYKNQIYNLGVFPVLDWYNHIQKVNNVPCDEIGMDKTFVQSDVNISNQDQLTFVEFDPLLLFIKLLIAIIMVRVFLAFENIK